MHTIERKSEERKMVMSCHKRSQKWFFGQMRSLLFLGCHYACFHPWSSQDSKGNSQRQKPSWYAPWQFRSQTLGKLVNYSSGKKDTHFLYVILWRTFSLLWFFLYQCVCVCVWCTHMCPPTPLSLSASMQALTFDVTFFFLLIRMEGMSFREAIELRE